MLKPYISVKGGKCYMYRATSTYSAKKGGPVAQTEYMGLVVDGKLKPKRGYYYDEKTGYFGPIEHSEPAERAGCRRILYTKGYGDVYLIGALEKRLSILDDLRSVYGDEKGREIMAAVMAYTIRPSAFMHIEEVLESRSIIEYLELPQDFDLFSPRMSELTKFLGEKTDLMDDFFRLRITGSEGEFLFDLTTEATYSAKNPAAEYGKNKQHLALKQINLGLVTDKVGHPLMFYLYPGSMADLSVVKRVSKDVIRLGGKGTTLVLDRGFFSPGCVLNLLEAGMDFVMPVILHDNAVTKAVLTSIIVSVRDVKKRHVYNGRSYTVVKKQVGVRRNKDANKEKRATLWEDPDGYDMLLENDEQFGSCDGYFDVFVYRDVKSAGEETAQMDIALDNICKKMNGKHPRDPQKSLEKAAGKLIRLLDWTMDKEKGMQVTVKQNAHSFASNRKGVFAMIVPTASERTWEDVLKVYDLRDKIEDVYFEDKDEGYGATPRTGKMDSIIGRTFIRMVSNIIRVEIMNKISEVANDKDMKQSLKPRDIDKRTPDSLLDSLSNIRKVYGNGWAEITELTKDNRLIYSMFNVGPSKDMVKSD